MFRKVFTDNADKVKSLNASIEREQALAVEEAGISAVTLPSGQSAARIGATGAAAVTENVAEDPKRGFRSLGDFARAVHAASITKRTGQAIDQRLMIGAAAPGSFGHRSGYVPPYVTIKARRTTQPAGKNPRRALWTP